MECSPCLTYTCVWHAVFTSIIMRAYAVPMRPAPMMPTVFCCSRLPAGHVDAVEGQLEICGLKEGEELTCPQYTAPRRKLDSPTKRFGSQPLYCPARMNLSPSTTRRAAANVSASASSAVVSVSTPMQSMVTHSQHIASRRYCAHMLVRRDLVALLRQTKCDLVCCQRQCPAQLQTAHPHCCSRLRSCCTLCRPPP